MKLPRGLAGKEVARALERMGFTKARQRGSHMIYCKGEYTVVIPDHRPIPPGTLKGILHQADITLDELFKHL